MQRCTVVCIALFVHFVSTLPLENVKSVQQEIVQSTFKYENFKRAAENGDFSFAIVPLTLNGNKEPSAGPPVLFIRQSDQGQTTVITQPNWGGIINSFSNGPLNPVNMVNSVFSAMTQFFNPNTIMQPPAQPQPTPISTPPKTETSDKPPTDTPSQGDAPVVPPAQPPTNIFQQATNTIQQQVSTFQDQWQSGVNSLVNNVAEFLGVNYTRRPEVNVLTAITNNAANTLPPLSSLTSEKTSEATTVKIALEKTTMQPEHGAMEDEKSAEIQTEKIDNATKSDEVPVSIILDEPANDV